jgi:hypothetical protein
MFDQTDVPKKDNSYKIRKREIIILHFTWGNKKVLQLLFFFVFFFVCVKSKFVSLCSEFRVVMSPIIFA